METAKVTVSYGEIPENLRTLEHSEYVFQKNEKNELIFGIFEGREAVLKFGKTDFLKFEQEAAIRLRADNGTDRITKMKLLMKFPGQAALINDAIFAAVAAYLKYQNIPEEKWGEHLLSSGEDPESYRMNLIQYRKEDRESSMTYPRSALKGFDLSIAWPEPENPAAGAEETPEKKPE